MPVDIHIVVQHTTPVVLKDRATGCDRDSGDCPLLQPAAAPKETEKEPGLETRGASDERKLRIMVGLKH